MFLRSGEIYFPTFPRLFRLFFRDFLIFFEIFSHFIELIEVVAGIRFRIWVAEKKAPEQFSRLRYSAQESGTDKYTNNLREYSKKHHVPAEIGLYLSRSPFTRPQKQKNKNCIHELSNNKKYKRIHLRNSEKSCVKTSRFGGGGANGPILL